MRRLIHGMRSGVDTASFIFTVKTDNTGTSASNQFTIPTQVVLGFPYNYNVKTSDGQTINGNTGNLTITFPSAGTYDISIKGLFPKIYFNNTGDRLKLLEVKQWGTNIIWHNLVNGFWGCANAIFDNILDVPTFNSTIAARSIMGNIFRDCGSLSTVGRLNDWDLSLNTSLERPFGGSTSKPFNQNIGNWDVSKVVNFTRCFEGCPNFNNGGNSSINNWTLNTSANVTFDAMFINCVSFNQPIGNWNTSRVVNTNSMFNNCQIFNQDLSNWNLGNNINMGNMFIGCTQFNNGGSNGIKDWDVKNVTTMSGVFLNCTNFNQPLTNWDTTKVTTTLQMFQSCVNFNQDLSTWNTANVTNMGAMFRFARAFNQNLGNWNVTKVSSFNFMFNTNNANPMVFNNGGSPDINNWIINTSTNVTMVSMFAGPPFNQPIGNWNTSRVIDMNFMFAGSGFNQDITNWDTGNVTNMNGMFYESNSFDQPIGNWDVSKVTNFASMFRINPFNQNLSNWDVSSATNMSQMFLTCNQFNNGGDPGINNWDVRNVTNAVTMFSNATVFSQDISDWHFENLTLGTNFRSTANVTTLPSVQLDAIYNKWTDKTLQPSVTISFGTAKYTVAATEARALLTRAASTKTITNAVNNGSGLIRISATAHGLSTGNKCFISGVVGTTEANGGWFVTVIDVDTIDLDGSTFTNAYTSGGILRTGYGWTVTDGGI